MKKQNSTVSEYYYHLKDHVGNIRVTFSTTPENYQMKEDFEGGDNGFTDLHQHTDFNANTTQPHGSNDKVGLLQSGETGGMVFLSMNKGDTIDLSVKVNYETAPTGNNFLGTAYSALFGQFDAVYGSGIEGGVAGSSGEFDEALAGIDMTGKNNSSTAPRAFLNYIFFDREMNYVTAGFLQIGTAALRTAPHDYEQIAINDIIADQEGYILAYLSNENSEAVNIFFDDMEVYHGKTNVVYATNYYPYGATFSEFNRTASEPQRYKFQGHEWMPDLTSYDLGPRMWDPYTLRTNAPDILADQFPDQSPYSLFRGNPIRYTDPTGMAPVDMIGDNCCDDDPNIIEQAVNDFTNWLGSVVEAANFDGSFFDFSSEESIANVESTLENAGEVAKVAKIGQNLESGEVSPFVTVSVGKQTSGLFSMVPGYAEITVSPNGVEVNTGYDVSTGKIPSVSITGGLEFGSSNIPLEPSVGGSIGTRHIGIDASSTLDFNKQSIGVTVSTEDTWGSVYGSGKILKIDR